MFPHLPGIYDITDPDFLAANRKGEIAPQQAALLGSAGRAFFQKFQRGSRLSGIPVLLALVFFMVLQLAGIRINTPIVLGAFGLALVAFAVQIGRNWTSRRRIFSQLEDDLQAGEVLDMIGVIGSSKHGAYLTIEDQKLRLPFGVKEGLKFGLSHRFYYLPQSKLILSAEVLEDQPDQEGVAGLTAALAEANRFQLSSLLANRRGELTQEQLPPLYRGLISPLLFILVPGGFVIYQLTRPGVLRGATLAEVINNLWILNKFNLLLGGILAALVGWALVLLVRTVMDIAGGQVAFVEDTGYRHIKTSSDEDGTSRTHLYLIGENKFRVSEQGYHTFEDGRRYRAFFTPRRKKLVNIEAIS